MFADVNGDGMADVCARLTTGEKCAVATGNGFTYPAGFDSNATGQHIFQNDSYCQYTPKTIRFADVNGDGRADVCGQSDDGVHCWLSTGTGWEGSIYGYASTPTFPHVFAGGGDERGYGDNLYGVRKHSTFQ